MKIAILVKQVPETRSVRMDESTGTVIRESNESIINPLDLYAVQAALQLKKYFPKAHLTAFSMGPAAAERVLKEALALGVDDAVLISDRAYAGSDTWATALILAAALRHAGGFDLILTGERATDGDTGQVGPELAAALGIGVVTFVEHLEPAGDALAVRRKNEHGEESLTLSLPSVVCVSKAVGEPGLPTLAGMKAARRRTIPVWSQRELALDPDKVGLKGSPTRVVKIFRPALARKCRKLTAADPAALQDAVTELSFFLAGGEA